MSEGRLVRPHRNIDKPNKLWQTEFVREIYSNVTTVI
jgi:hypothetical protein